MRTLAKTIDLVAAFDASPNPYMLLDDQFRYAGMNQAYLDVTQRRREDLLGQPVMEMFDGGQGEQSSENARQLSASFNKVMATGQPDHLAVLHYPIPVPQDDGATAYDDRYWSCTHTPIKDGGGRVTHILQHTTDITELEKLRRQIGRLRPDEPPSALDSLIGGGMFRRAMSVQADNRRLEIERRQLLDMFMQAPGFVAVLNGPDHIVQMHNDAYGQLIGQRQVIGKPIREALPELAGQGYDDCLDEVLATGEAFRGRQSPVQLQQARKGPPSTRYLDFTYQPIRDEAGKIIGVFVQGHDVTETVIAAERQKLMIDELNHRVKNTLATVQSIAMQTARSHEDPRTFAETFQSRILSLSHTHDLLTRSHWEGADLREVLEHETTAHGLHRLTLNGPNVALEPAMAVSLGMIFHELATNAAKYGALSTGEGRVMVDWSIADLNDPRLAILWRETGGPKVAQPERRGFGSRLVERNVRHDLAGVVQMHYRDDGLIVDINIPLNKEAA
ncbi:MULTISPECIES: PAS domain-containing protein [unclassified Brevundimonas]|uniref:PAS domain-containing protein n=1 Tax=unclassified Brevundimonas TaxID=2622653 RepID=UPI0025C60A02|nr:MULTISPECIES: PAS domain-containing protein [unclassified Brevundimonas]